MSLRSLLDEDVIAAEGPTGSDGLKVNQWELNSPVESLDEGKVNDNEGGKTRGDFLLCIDKHLTNIKNDLVNDSFSRVSNGSGILCCTVAGAANLDRFQSCFVKVLYVEPGTSDNVLFRSKQLVHTTPAISSGVSDRGSDFLWNSYFEYEIFPPLKEHPRFPGRMMSDWNSLTGDILFSLYEVHGGRSNKFVGQTLVPLRGLVDGISDSIHGGDQKLYEQDHLLRSRDGKGIMQGTLQLRLQLQLPPEEPITPTASPVNRRHVQKKKGSNIKSQRNSNKIKYHEIARHQTKHKARSRWLEAERINRENELINKRMNDTKATMKLPKEVTKLTKKREETLSISELLESIHKRRSNISELNKTLSQLKAGKTRTETMIQKLRRQNESLKKTIPKPRTEYRKIKSKRRNFKNTEEENTSKEILTRLRSRVLAALFKYDQLAAREKTVKGSLTGLKVKKTKLENDISEIQERTSEVEDRMQKRKNGVEISAHSSLNLLQEAKIDLRVTENTLLDLERTYTHEQKAILEEQENIKKKIENKTLRQKQVLKKCEELSEEYRSQHFDEVLSQLRLKITAIRSQLLLV